MRWLEEVKISLRPKTYRSYEQITRLYLIPHLGQLQLSKLTPLHILDLYKNLLETGRVADTATGKAGKGLSPAAVRTIHRTIKSAMEKAVDWERLTKNPVDKIKPPAKDSKEFVTLSPEEAARFLETAKATGLYSLYLAALTTGMRQGELLGLRWSNVNLEKKTAVITQQLTRGGMEPAFGDPKTAKGVRTITLPAKLVEILAEEWENEQRDRDLPGNTSKKYDLVWHTSTGNPLSSRNLTRQFKTLLQRAGCPDIRFHDLRHTHATILLKSGIHPRVVQERLGHSDIAVTLNTYSHVTKGLQEDAADRIDKIFDDKG